MVDGKHDALKVNDVHQLTDLSQTIDVYSFFSGIGLLDLGFENAGFNIEFVSDIKESFLRGYKHSRMCIQQPSPRYGYWNASIDDALNHRVEDSLSEAVHDSKSRNKGVLFIGGPPCPDFSVGGKNHGKYGDNGRLSKSYVDVILKYKPDGFLFENVKGLWRTKRHREFYEEIKSILTSNGYIITERLVNAIEYGVPQDRERIILIGFHQTYLQEARDLGENGYITDFPWDKYKVHNVSDVYRVPWPQTTEFQSESTIICPTSVITELTVEYWFKKNRVLEHPNANHCFVPRAGLAKFKTIAEGDVSKKSYKRLHRWRYSPTAAYGNNEVHLHPYYERRLSVAEALSIQSLPAEFVLPDNMSLSDMFKSVGNGVPYLLALGIAKTILHYLGGKYASDG
ncbi:MAG: DNA cytosine methyltransferase [Candidatus Izemoplasmatales bacterium]|jgi:DNA (cytosine-5)-methyltransferase 1